MAAASATASFGGTRSPFTPSTTMSGLPPTAVATTARPHDIASRTTPGSGSGQTDGATPNRLRSQAAITTACGTLLSTVTPEGKCSGVSG